MIAAALLLGVAACAQAATHTHTARKSGPSVLIGVGNIDNCLKGSSSGLGVLRTYHAKILRIVISPRQAPNGQALGCIKAARAHGYRVHIAIAYFNQWPIKQDVAYFRGVLGHYARYAWAISIGNEQELLQGSKTESGARYAAVWKAVEPLVAARAPHAIRVAGEISPWGFGFLRTAWAAGLPGAQVIGVHAYTGPHGVSFAQVLSWVRRTHRPLWVTEGLTGPHAWPNGVRGLSAVPLAKIRGAAVAEAWLF
jgi:hypothetical protein